MKRKVKLFSITLVFGISAIVSIIFDLVWVEFVNPLLMFNPVLDILFHNGFSSIIDIELQRQETNSAIFHYTKWAFFIHLVSYILVGRLIDLIKNKFFFGKVSELN
ncbi:hypothetical protein [Paenisporosarcina indica]|uniref:hypothetical protein n=1 Tax=Paenisporosarcina indica TaxID=650093 RepID=UPI00094F7409|nr:hypothetical protein [Paenisporosarcina indica]